MKTHERSLGVPKHSFVTKSNALKALFAIFVMAIFAISIVPATIAEDAAGTTDSSSVVVSNEKTAKELRDNIAKERETLKENIKSDREAFKQKVEADREALKQKIMEKRNSPEFRARVEKAKELAKMEPEQRREQVKALGTEDFREFQKKQLMIAVEKCKENPNINQSKCQEKLEKRVALIDKLTQKDAERLKKLEERKTEKQQEVEALKKDVAFVKYKMGKEVKAREIAKERLQEKKEQYQKAEEKFKEIKEQEKELNEKLSEARQELKEACKDNQNSTECSAAKQELITEAKEVLLKQAGLMLESIEKIKAKVDASEDLSDEEAAQIIADLDAAKTEIENAKKIIETSQSQEELIAAAKTINRAWNKAKPRLKLHAAKVVNARIGGIIVQSKQLQVKLERVMAKMQEKGADTAKVQPLVDKFNINIESAKNHYKLAVDSYLSTNQESAAASAQTHLNDAHKALQDARAVLVDITKELRAQKSTDLLSDDTDDAEEAVETTASSAEEVAAADTAQVSVEAETTSDTTTAADATASS